MVDIPAEHAEDNVQLTGDGKVFLYEITPLSGGVLRLKADNDITWQANTWEGVGIMLEEVERTSDDQVARPKLTIANPAAVYSTLVKDGQLDNAVVSRYIVLKSHIDADTNIFQRQTWKVRQVSSLNRQVVVLELRDQTDGQAYLMPPRQYLPPNFPLVSLQ